MGNWYAIGRSVEGRDIRLRRLGRGPRTVLWIGAIHGDEQEGSVATAELADEFQREPALVDAVTLVMLEDANPDGAAHQTRHNARGIDLNRNFPAANFRPSRTTGRAPLDQPEARVLHDLIEELSPHLVVVSHSISRRGPFINFDGPAEQLAQRFSRFSGYPVLPSSKLHATPGSLGSWVGIDLGIPILTLEYRRGEDPRRAWAQTRNAILEVIRGT